ncbi:hypothetical protein [Bacteroides sp. 519]|uniref:hypothetical protein n=1 Tax=Bacteroides sp. 519 TaxID=2302937 RepID=UPI0013D7710C|nr:hypothetical protein [Bacteroides sp. 519]NDV60010.1 hypothetical protein [Bacteroides sp. 519]
MKIKTIFATAIVAMLALSSCSNDEETSQGVDETQSFFIQIGKPGIKNRAEGANMDATQVSFTDGYLIFTSNDKIGRVIKIVETASAADEITVSDLETGTVIGKIPANTKNVYLYGNTGALDIASVAVENGSLSNVEALMWELTDIQNTENNVAKVPVYGKGDVAPGTTNPERLESKFNVGPIGSRLQIGEISCTDANVEKLELAGIYINSFYHSMNAANSFDDTNLVDYSIDKAKYSAATGYASYLTMKDELSPVVDIKPGAAKPTGTGNFWAYNFFPSTMPHIVLHFASLKVTDKAEVTNMYATVAKYSTAATGGTAVATAEAGYVYTLNIDISDYENQISDLPESSSSVMGYVDIDIINWQSKTIYPEW